MKRQLPTSIAVAGTRVTSIDRVVYPDDGVTKGDLVAYYDTVFEAMLPHLRERPVTLLRCPDGVGRECFFQKHGGEGTPAVVPRVNVRGEGSEEEPYVYVDGRPALMALVQLNVLEFHVWNSRVDDLEHPDQLVFDLDPGPGLAFREIVRAAREIRDRLREVRLTSFVKTTGGKGLHVIVPLRPVHPWSVVTTFAKVFARVLAREQPERYTARLRGAREGRIFIDYLRNGRNANQVAAYSTRARPGATVSVPLRWDELRSSLDPRTYHVRSVARRVRAQAADPWEGFEKARAEITVDVVERLTGGG